MRMPKPPKPKSTKSPRKPKGPPLAPGMGGSMGAPLPKLGKKPGVRGKKPPGPPQGPGISYEKLAGAKKPYNEKTGFAQHLGQTRADQLKGINDREERAITAARGGYENAVAATGRLKAGDTTDANNLTGARRESARAISQATADAAQKRRAVGPVTVVSPQKLAGAKINPDNLETKKAKVDRTLQMSMEPGTRRPVSMDVTTENKTRRPVSMDVTSQQMQTVPRDKIGRNKKVNYSTAGRALDPFTNESMEKGRPVPAQSMSPLAQGARQFSQSVDDAILGPLKKGRVSKQLLAGSKPAKFDPKAFAKMRTDLKQEQGQAARIASRVPKAPPSKPAIDPLASASGGLGSRKRLGNRLQGG